MALSFIEQPDGMIFVRRSAKKGASIYPLSRKLAREYRKITLSWNDPDAISRRLQELGEQAIRDARHREMRQAQRASTVRLSNGARHLARILQELSDCPPSIRVHQGKVINNDLQPSLLALANETNMGPSNFVAALKELHSVSAISMRGASFRQLEHIARLSQRARGKNRRQVWLNNLSQAASHETLQRQNAPDRLRTATAAVRLTPQGERLIAA